MFMKKNNKKSLIYPHMTVLDIVSTYRNTEKIFKQWDEIAGECICCNALFESLKDITQKYKLDLTQIMAELEGAAQNDLPTHSK